jgi:hypothetical protein
MDDAQAQLDSFIDKFTPEVAALSRALLARMKARIPGAQILVYDNYNALVFGFGPSDRPSEAVLSLAIMPRWVTLCFLKGAKLRDPKKLLGGAGNIVRNIHLTSPRHLDDPDLRELIDQSIAEARPKFSGKAGNQKTVIKSVSAKQRPRRPA